MRRVDSILLTLTLIVCVLFVRACHRGDWPFRAAVTVAVLSWPDAHTLLLRGGSDPAMVRAVQRSLATLAEGD